MATLMRAHDWASTSLGPSEAWPQSLKTVVRILLTSRFQMWMAWGADLAFFYNDAYRPTLGVKHGRALGRPATEVWAEIWTDIGPLIDEVMRTGVASWNEGLLLLLERSGFREETYHTFSYSPLADDAGDTVGMLCVVIEETERVIGERRLAFLGALATDLASINAENQVFAAVERRTKADARDLPFTLTYLFDADGQQARLACATGIVAGHPLAPTLIEPDRAGSPWPAADMLRSVPVIIENLATRSAGDLPFGPWNISQKQAVAVPLKAQGQEQSAGFLVVGLNPYRRYDAEYSGFVDLFAGQIASGLANAHAYELERRRAETLAEIDRAKTAFFSNVSHEFRTPLTLMLGPLEESLADSDRLMPEERERITVVHRNGLRLLKLVNSLLDFSRIEAGRVQASFEPTDLSGFTSELASNFRSAIEKAGLDLIVDCPPCLEPVHVDREMWEKIVLNLLSNAFKFTFEGEIAVALKACDDAVVLTVRDTGAGIPAHELPRLFERFHRVEGARGRSHEGSGIGLALVQDLVRLHGGAIRVDSEEGRGSTFTVSLPLGAEHLPQEHVRGPQMESQRAGRAQAYVEEVLRWLPDGAAPGDGGEGAADSGLEPPDATRPRVLLADDNADMRDYVGRLLGERHEVEAVADGEAALHAVRRHRPDLVLSDVMMPRLDGFGLLRAIRADPDLRDLPVILLSARAGEEAGVEGLEAGADDYLVKPFSARELIARVRTALAMARLRRENTETLRQLNEALEGQIAERTRERDRMWSLSQDMFAVFGLDGTLVRANPAWTDILGLRPDEVEGQHHTALKHPDDWDRGNAGLVRLGQGSTIAEFEDRYRHRDGSYRWISWTATAPQGDLIYAAGRDVTGRRELEEQLRQAQKMEAIGHLTGGVAHDFNNLLTIVVGNIESLLRHLPAEGPDRLRRSAENAMQGARRAATLTQRLLAFSRRQPLDPKPIAANKLVAGMSDMLARTLGERIEIQTVLAGGLWPVEADPNQLESALLNLAVNARDAMATGGKLTIETANAHLDEAYAATAAEVLPGQYVVLAVSDTGTGMQKDVIARVFEPFFTTKPTGHGTGLGLSQVYGFVKQSGGHVKIYSEPGEGTTVKIYLPRLIGSGPQDETEDATVPDGHRGETVLVVEDEAGVREYSAEILRELGYRVLEAPDGPAALRQLERHASIDLLFTDVGLPGMNGRELADEARKRRPKLKVLFTTGYARNAIVHQGRLDPGVQMIGKPFTYADLAAKVRSVIDADG